MTFAHDQQPQQPWQAPPSQPFQQFVPPPTPEQVAWEQASWQQAQQQQQYAQQQQFVPPFTQQTSAPMGPQPPVSFRPPAQPQVAPVEAHLAPTQLVAQAHERNMMAAVVTLVATVVGLWATLGYLHSTTNLMGGIAQINKHILVQMQTSQTGLVQLNEKTSQVAPMARGAAQLQVELGSLNGSMGEMLADVNSVSGSMKSMETSLGTLNGSLDTVNATNGSLGGKLQAINKGLGTQASEVHGMRADVGASAAGLSMLPPKLTATGDRLTYINGSVCTLGQKGVQAPTNIHISLLGLNNGSASISTTMVPAGAWSC